MLFRTKKAEDESKSDWVDDVTEMIEGAIDQIRDKAVVPLTTVARAIVYGLLVAIVGFAALVLITIGFVRFLVVYLNNVGFLPDGVWFPYMTAGGLFVAVGLFFWSKSRHHVKNAQK